jgi:hypothetical protein
MDLIEIQKIIYDKLKELKYPVVDDFVLYQETTPPYIQLSSLYISENNTKVEEGLYVEQYINIYSDYRGKKEILEIAQEVSEVMNFRTDSIYVKEDRKSIILDIDKNNNRFYHAVLIFKIYIQE